MRASFAVEVVGEVIKKDGRRILVTNKAIPEYIKLLIMLALNERPEDIFLSVRFYEEMVQTFYKILNLK